MNSRTYECPPKQIAEATSTKKANPIDAVKTIVCVCPWLCDWNNRVPVIVDAVTFIDNEVNPDDPVFAFLNGMNVTAY